MYTFYAYLSDFLENSTFHLFIFFFAYVWLVWILKASLAFRYRPFRDRAGKTRRLRTTVLVPVFDESPFIFRRVLRGIRINSPAELIVVVDGGDDRIASIASEYADRVIRMPKLGKRAAIAEGLRHSDRSTDLVAIVDSDTIWTPTALRELAEPFADLAVGGVTPRQAIFKRGQNNVRRLADWMEDLRYNLTVPAQSTVGQVGCLAGRTIVYRRSAVEPAVERLVEQRVLGVAMHVGDDRVLTNELLRRGWKTVYQRSALVYTDAPNTWRGFWKQQLRWGRSSQRETILSLKWLWRRPFALLCFLSDIIIPFLLYAVLVGAVVRIALGRPSPIELPVIMQLGLAYVGMMVSIGIRQIGHFRRHPGDLPTLPIFVLQLTFFMAPIRIIAFATMFHQAWHTRGVRRRVSRRNRAVEGERVEGTVAPAGSS